MNSVHERKNNIFLICLYRASTWDVNVFQVKLETPLFSLPPKPLIILAGDLNVNYKLHSTARENFRNSRSSFNEMMHVEQSTRITQPQSIICAQI